jgi:hypothetical protein
MKQLVTNSRISEIIVRMGLAFPNRLWLSGNHLHKECGLTNILLKGSRNHLRASTGRLSGLGIDYVPAYISQEGYDVIISSESGYPR